MIDRVKRIPRPGARSVYTRTTLSSAIRILGLLPARNAEADLALSLAAMTHLVDAVVALDDGSTDGTYELLRTHESVVRVMRNRIRSSYHGWDDSKNRQRLLESADALRPAWIVFLDADEVIDRDDATDLRAYLLSGAAAQTALGVRVFRMVGNLETYVLNGLWTYRVFPWRRQARLPRQRLHFEPVPLHIPRETWLRTSVRVKHLASLTRERQEQRYQRYLEADARCEFQDSYENLLARPRGRKRWRKRPRGTPIPLGDDNWIQF